MATATKAPNEGLKFTVTKKDVEDATRICVALYKSLPQFKPSQIGGPVLVAILRTSEGFPLVGYESIAVVKTPESKILHNIYQRFLDGKSTAKQFSAAATPLFIKLWAEEEAGGATDTQEFPCYEA